MTEEIKPKKPIWKRWWLWLIIIFVIILIASGGSQKPTKVGEVSKEETKGSESQIYAVGDKVKLGSAIISVNNVEFSQGGPYTKPAEGNEWINLNITIENTGSTNQYVTTLGQMFIRDGENNSYQVSVTDKVLENPTFGLDGTILPKSKRTGWVGFEIKKAATGLQFQYNGSIWGGGTVLINLGR